MLTRCLSASVARSLHSIPGATCSHSGSDPPPCRRQHRLFPGLLGDTKRKARLQRCRRTQHIGGPGDEAVDDRAQALQLALAIRARGDVGFGRGNLARRQDLQRVGARQLDPFAAAPGVGGMRGLHTPKTSKASFWIGPTWRRPQADSWPWRRSSKSPMKNRFSRS